MRESTSKEIPVRRAFPGPRGAQSSLRVAIDRRAHADLVAHAKESLNAEICGVLAGNVCEDDEGRFVHVQAVIRGTAANQGSTHVTFTQATWSAIHQSLERDHPELKIVGWYHSHPGFGVEFSEMDLFIQRNFFSSQTQIALVTDPLSGAMAVCINTPRGIEYLPCLWVDGREQSCQVPAKPAAGAGSADTGRGVADETARKLQELESRLGQLVLAMDDQRNSLHRFLLFIGTVLCLAIIGVGAYAIFQQLKARIEPPKNVGYAPVPVQIGDKTALLGVAVVKWDLPPEWDVMQAAMEQVRHELENAAAKAATNAPGSKTNGPVVPASTNPTPVLTRPQTKP